MKLESVSGDSALNGARNGQASTATNRHVCIATPDAHVFLMREDELPGYLDGVRIVLFACGIVVLVELFLALIL